MNRGGKPDSRRPNGLDDFHGGWETPGLFPRKNHFAVDDDVELALTTQLDLGFHTEFVCQFPLEAPGLLTSIGSKEASFDNDFHRYRVTLRSISIDFARKWSKSGQGAGVSVILKSEVVRRNRFVALHGIFTAFGNIDVFPA